jgi:hypothetical protein
VFVFLGRIFALWQKKKEKKSSAKNTKAFSGKKRRKNSPFSNKNWHMLSYFLDHEFLEVARTSQDSLKKKKKTQIYFTV